jgi:2-C-methyl-D-erythritol 4-phosphate cytidylyltransferase
MESIVAIIPAAGQGKRMNSDLNKQYLSLNERPVVAHTIEIFQRCGLIEEVIVVVREDEIDYCQREVINKHGLNKSTKVVRGGETRQESVYNGLQTIGNADYVVVHDGARPLITEEILEKAILEAREYEAVGVAVPVKDTIKETDSDGFVNMTPDRSKLWAIQTPQVFAYNLLLKAYGEAIKDGIQGTDSSMLVEKLGKRVKLLKGNYDNLKITTPEDLVIAETIMKERA